MPYTVNKFKIINNKFKISFLLFVFLNVSLGWAQGLQFKSNDSLLTKRTSFQVFQSDAPVFQDQFYINFDLSLWDNSNLGYIFNLYDGYNSYSLSYLYYNGSGYLNFNIDSKSNKIKILLQPSLLKKGKWMKVKLNFDLKADKIELTVNNQPNLADHMGFKNKTLANIIFGKNQYYTEVPNMAIKNLVIGDESKTYGFPLDEWNGNEVHDSDGNATGMVENPVWLINQSYFWKLSYRKEFKDVAGLNFNTKEQNLFIFSKDSLITFDPESKNVSMVAYKNPLPVPMVLGKSIFNAAENKCYIYELFDIHKGMPSVASLNMDKNNLTWQTIGKVILPYQLHHHNIFYDVKMDSFYLFGGYGSYSYHNTFLKYNRENDQWDKVNFTGDQIMPRFFAATGNSDKADELFLFGGYGNESGNQIVGGKQYYDFYRIDLKKHSIKKCWVIHPEKEIFVPANNLILSKDKKYFYALCYPHEIAKTELRLYKFSIKDGSYEVVSAPIPVTSERIETDNNLFYDKKTDEFFCTTQEFLDRKSSVIKIYTLTASPVSSASYLKSLKASKKYGILFYSILTLAALGLISGLGWLYKRKQNIAPIADVPPALADEASIKQKFNSVYLLGEFIVFDKKGKDITYLFSPKIKQLFLLILLNSGKGVSSKKISATLWPDKDLNKTKNIKGVTFNHLRNIIADINGIDLAFLNETYAFIINDSFFCDYLSIADFIKDPSHFNDISVSEPFQLMLRGAFLKDITDAWLDDFKYAYEEKLIAIILPELKKQYALRELKLSLEMSKLILSMSPFHEEALKIQLKTYKRLKGIEYAHTIYDQFILDYKRSLGTDFPVSFEKIIQ